MLAPARSRILGSARPAFSSICRELPRATLLPAASANPRLRTFSTSSSIHQANTVGPLLQDEQNGFGFARSNRCPKKPRAKGVTEIRGPYYSVCLLADILPQKDVANLLSVSNAGHGKAVSEGCPRDVSSTRVPSATQPCAS
jgi:hypothetical protein